MSATWKHNNGSYLHSFSELWNKWMNRIELILERGPCVPPSTPGEQCKALSHFIHYTKHFMCLLHNLTSTTKAPPWLALWQCLTVGKFTFPLQETWGHENEGLMTRKLRWDVYGQRREVPHNLIHRDASREGHTLNKRSNGASRNLKICQRVHIKTKGSYYWNVQISRNDHKCIHVLCILIM